MDQYDAMQAQYKQDQFKGDEKQSGKIRKLDYVFITFKSHEKVIDFLWVLKEQKQQFQGKDIDFQLATDPNQLNWSNLVNHGR